ncbi:hypothetical protein [Paenibacillus turpanensis]|uniref:hypothetical protein n=1 Tax=Paenibacillus turpanensis TaxID=2689078 RepID=UPI001408FF9B|nr:hypothetical protein [Paenibacillus turpanensis]
MIVEKKIKFSTEHLLFVPVRVKLGAVALAVAGVLFLLYPAFRPFSDEASLQGAQAFASPEWVVSHVMAIFAFVFMTIGLMGLNISLQGTRAERLSFRGLLLSWIGTGLLLPYYGAEVFGLYAIGLEAIGEQNPSLVRLAHDIRFGPGFSMIVGGLVLLAIGTIIAAMAVWNSRILSKWSGIPIALGFLLYLPQYAAAQPVRIAHGLLITIGCIWMAASMWRYTMVEKNDNESL